MAESKVGRMGSTFFVLVHAPTNARLAYLWQRALHRDIPNEPFSHKLEFYQFENRERWSVLFRDTPKDEAALTARFLTLISIGEISLRRVIKSPSGIMRLHVYDPDQLTVRLPTNGKLESVEIGNTGLELPKTFVYSNLVVLPEGDPMPTDKPAPTLADLHAQAEQLRVSAERQLEATRGFIAYLEQLPVLTEEEQAAVKARHDEIRGRQS